MSGYRQPELPRDQQVLFAHRLDEAVAEGHSVRAFDRILRSETFSKAFAKMGEVHKCWEGKPPYAPRYMAALWLYGLSNRLRSSRALEAACHNRVDVKWLMEGQTPDHSSIAGFVKRHQGSLKELLRATLQVAAEAELLKLAHLAVDGSKVEAAAAKASMKRATTIEAELATVNATVEALTKDYNAQDEQENLVFGAAGSWAVPKGQKTGKELRAAVRRQEKLQAALEAMDRRTAEHAATHADKPPTPAGSTTDADARLMKDKEGRSKPNYTPQTAVDAATGLIVAETVTDAPCDGNGLLPMVEQAVENTGIQPQAVSADSAYNSGAALMTLEEKGITGYMPDSGMRAPSSLERTEALDAIRTGQDLTAAQWTLVLDARTKRLAREAFRYDPVEDQYVCPRGAVLHRGRTTQDHHQCGTGLRTQYSADPASCAACPIRDRCLQSKGTYRMITRDQFEPERERLRARMATSEGRAEYRKRTVTERTYSWLKDVVGLRKFNRRGFAGVRAEYTLACTALNMRILARMLGAAAAKAA